MKKLILLTIVSISLTSCGGIVRGITGASKSSLIKQVAVETGCPKENVKIIEKSRNRGAATYALDVCGERKIYKQIGSVFMSSGEADKMTEKLQNKK